MRLHEDETGQESVISERRSVDRLDGFMGTAFIALGLLLCVLFWFGVYMLVGGPLP